MKYTYIPFDIELAKKIQNKEIEGEIVTRVGHDVRIVCFDRNYPNYPILALINDNNKELARSYNKNGYWSSIEDDYDLMLKIPEYFTFKDGDIITMDSDNIIFIVKKYKNNPTYYLNYYIKLDNSEITFGNEDSFCFLKRCRLATEEEKQKFIKLLKQSKEPQVKEYLKKFFNIEEYKFTPFEKVLVRNSEYDDWEARFFNRMHKNLYGCTDSNFYKYCITYNNDTEHLLGTNKNI